MRAASFKRLLGARRWMLMTVPRMVSILKDARSVSKNLVPALHPARRRLPAPRHSRLKQLAI